MLTNLFQVLPGLIFPLLGTTIGASLVFLLRNRPKELLQRSLISLSAGVMVAACFWSLLSPSISLSSSLGTLSFLPALVGFWLGIGLMFVIDNVIPHLHIKSNSLEGPSAKLERSTLIFFSVAIHNFPEGMAIGVVYSGLVEGVNGITPMVALSLTIGIAIQNIPEGAIISFPLRLEGKTRSRAFYLSFLSGCVEPLGMLLTIFLSSFFVLILPYFLSFAAGAMMYVIVEDLIPEMSKGEHTNLTSIIFAFGFSIMMVLDVALG